MSIELTFSRALLACERVEGRITGGPVVEINKTEIKRHYRRDKVPFDWRLGDDSILRIGYHAIEESGN